MKNNQKIRKQILGLVKEFYQNKLKEEFIPGKTLIRQADAVCDEKEMLNLVEVALDFWLTSGRYSREFEEKLTRFLGTKYCILTNSGSSANLLAVSTLTSPKLGERRLKPGDEVITTACGFPTTLNPIIQNNLVPVFVDIQLGSYNINADKIEKAISSKTKAIFIAHTLGNPVDLSKILPLVKKYKLWFIEDNCDALGSEFQRKKTGSFGHISTCSFYPAHHLTTGEGGAVFTNDLFLKKIINSFSNWGRDCWCNPGDITLCNKRFVWKFGKLPFGYDHKYIFSHIGYNLKMTDMQAAIGAAQMDKLPRFIAERRKNFNFFNEHLEKFKDFFVLPQIVKNSNPSWFGFPLLVRENAPFTRGDIVNYLEKYKIATRMLFGGNLLKQPAYQKIKYRKYGSLKNTDLVMNNFFWFGVYPGIDRQKLNFIAEKISEFIKNRTVKK